MSGLPFLRHRTAARLAAIDGYAFPDSVRRRFAERHPQLDAAGVETVQAAARQWFRLTARHPKARLAMPSAAVDDLWHELVLHTRDYAAFCDAAFGRFLHHQPESAMSAAAVAANRTETLLTTLRLAQRDEGGDEARLPLLFRVDGELGVPDGRRYLLDCGGRHRCFPADGLICLRHLTGVPGRRRLWRDPQRAIARHGEGRGGHLQIGNHHGDSS